MIHLLLNYNTIYCLFLCTCRKLILTAGVWFIDTCSYILFSFIALLLKIKSTLAKLCLFEVNITSVINILSKRILDVKEIVLFFGHVKHICV